MKKERFLFVYWALCAVIVIALILGLSLFYRSSRIILSETIESKLNTAIEVVFSRLEENDSEYIKALEAYNSKYLVEGLNNPEEGATSAEGTDEYQKLLDILLELEDLLHAEYIYLINWVDSSTGPGDYTGFYFVIDTDLEYITYVGQHYLLNDKTTKVFNQAFENPGQVFTDLELVDEYGEFSAGFRTLYTDINNPGAIIAVDLGTGEDLIRHRTQFILTITILVGSLTVIFIVTGFYLQLILKRNHEMQDRISQMAYHDALTNLPNRSSLMSALKKMIDENRKNSEKKLAVLFIDLDNFKKVNDSEGHLVGDSLLQDIADFLRKIVGKEDFVYRPGGGTTDFVARLGGDEFVILNTMNDESDLIPFIERIFNEFAKFSESNYMVKKYSVSLSVGAAFLNKDQPDAASLLKSADVAMYKAKSSGKSQYYIFKEEK